MTTVILDRAVGSRRIKLTNTSGNAIVDQESVVSRHYGFTKPAVVRVNPKVDGYRKPSPYRVTYAGNAFLRSKTFGEFAQSGGNVWSIDGDMPMRAGLSPIYDWDFNEVQFLRTRVLNNVRSEILDVAMVLAEISGTAETLTGNLLKVARSMDAIKKRKPDSFHFLLTGERRDRRRPTEKFLHDTAGEYLQWKYGIMPSVYDIAGACKGLDMSADGSLFDNPPLLVARSSRRWSKVEQWQFDQPAAPWGQPYVRVPVTIERELHARLDYRVDGEGLRGLNRYGLGLTSLATVAFDKTPFSFVLNMAIPIADLIKAWGALAGVHPISYVETAYAKAYSQGGIFTDLREAWVTHDIAPGDLGFVFDRRVFDSPPMPLPFVRNPVSVGNVSSVLALFTQMWTSKKMSKIS